MRNFVESFVLSKVNVSLLWGCVGGSWPLHDLLSGGQGLLIMNVISKATRPKPGCPPGGRGMLITGLLSFQQHLVTRRKCPPSSHLKPGISTLNLVPLTHFFKAWETLIILGVLVVRTLSKAKGEGLHWLCWHSQKHSYTERSLWQPAVRVWPEVIP